MSHLMTCVDAPNYTWTDLAMPILAGVNCAKHWEESIQQYPVYRGLDEEEYSQKPINESLPYTWYIVYTRKTVYDRKVSLPQNWNDFLAGPCNKQKLSLLLSK